MFEKGINDAPALHNADIGISVDTAVDVASEAADLILLRRNLGILANGVQEGRRTFGNVRKYIMMGTSSNFGNMFSMAAAALLLPFLPMQPVQILLNNVLYHLSESVLPLDAVDQREITTPQKWDMGFLRDFMLTMGPARICYCHTCDQGMLDGDQSRLPVPGRLLHLAVFRGHCRTGLCVQY